MKIENVKGLLDVLNGDARNALHSILGFLELVSEGALDPAQRRYVEACRNTADQHCREIEDVRLVLGLPPEETKVVKHFAPADLFAGVAEVIQAAAARKDIGLIREVDSSVPPVVLADADRIGYTLVRVAQGTVNATEGGDIHLKLGAFASPGGYHLTFEIRALQTVLPRVMIDALRHGEFEFDGCLAGGDAVGMAAARQLATALDGRVDASADAATGTRIMITIPVVESAGTMVLSQPIAKPSTEAHPALRILVAEDSDANFQLLTAYLKGQQHTVARATNGAEAVELANTGKFDLLFMDIRMPVMDGYTATRRIGELERGQDRPRMPIVVLSAEDLRSQRRQGALVGCSGHLSKPLRKHELQEAIRAYSMIPNTTTFTDSAPADRTAPVSYPVTSRPGEPSSCHPEELNENTD